MKIKGINEVRRNMRQFFENEVKKRSDSAVYAVLSQGRAYSDTITPVDLTSTLLNSGYAPVITHESSKTVGHIGYTAEYALHVHNSPGTWKGLPRANGNGNYWDPQGEPQFLVKGFEAIKLDIPRIIKAAYSV